jgi:hypothetical protein
MKKLILGVLIPLMAVYAVFRAEACATAEYRRDVVQARTIQRHKALIDGLVEQVDQQADEIERLETALKDATR